jgi:hypothetical protein
VCAVVGHRWDWKSRPDIDVCRRCGITSDEPSVKIAERRRVAIRTYSPIWPKVTRTGASLRLGWAYKPFTANLWIGLHWGWDRTGELPGVSASLDLWRLRLSAGIGGGWQDEDGETRGFVYMQGRVQTYGWRYIGCWFGHKPEPSSWNPSDIYCARCDESLTRGEREPSPPEVAA